MLFTALEPEQLDGTRRCAGIAFLCPGCGQHQVRVWLRPPLDCGAPEPEVELYGWDWREGGFGLFSLYGTLYLGTCGAWRIERGEVTPA